VGTAGDVNRDGYDDVIVGAKYYDVGGWNEGRAFVYHGSATGLGTTSAWTANDPQPIGRSYFGISVGTAGDVNGDGYDDVIVGAYWYNGGQGRAYVYHGSAAGLSKSPVWTASHQLYANFGVSVGTAGDVNGDGYDDVIIGARAYDGGQADEGRAYVYHGSPTGLSTSPDWTAEGNQSNALFGQRVGTAGDVNGDGYSDVIVGAFLYDSGQRDEGKAFVWYGSNTGLGDPGTPDNADWTAESDQAYAEFGIEVGTVGDVNGDGYDDVIVGAQLYDDDQEDEGRAYVYHGSATGLSATAAWTAKGGQADAHFGHSGGTAGDVNRDGYDDVIVGAYWYNGGQGRAYIYHGSATGLSATAAWTAESDQAGAHFGASVGTAGDVNRDGYPDVIIGAPRYDADQGDEGRAYVYNMSPHMPAITQVQPCFEGAYFLKDIALDNRFDARVDWKDRSPDRVEFTLNDSTTSETATALGASHTYNVGQDLGYALLGQDNELRVVAYNTQGDVSWARTRNLIGVSAPSYLPGWSVSPTTCPAQPQAAKYSARFSFPTEPMEANVTFPNWFPYLGGQTYGLEETQASLAAELQSTGQATLAVTGTTGFEAAGQSVEGTLSGSGTGTVKKGEGISFTNGTFGIDISGVIKQTKGIVDVIPQLKAAEQTPGVGEPIKWFNEKAKLEATIKPKVELTLGFESKSEGWSWKSATGSASSKMTLALIVDIMENLSASAYGGGTPTVTLQVPADPSYLKEVSAELLAGVELTIFDQWSKSYEKTHTWSYSPSGSTTILVQETGTRSSPERDWRLIGRDYMTDPAQYALFTANQAPQSPGLASTRATTETQILANVFPYSDLALATSGDQALLLWQHDDPSKPVTQSLDISYTLWDGTSWSAPAALTDDTLQDFQPLVAFDGTGGAMAVWQRATQPMGDQPTITFTKGIELAYATWDGITWSVPQLLTTNNALDHQAALAPAGDGRLLLTWVANSQGKLLGDAEAPDTIYASLWDGSSWSAPQVVLSDLTGLLGMSLAYRGDEAMFFYSRDMDGDMSTIADEELFALSWGDGGWGNPVRLTDDSLPDASPIVLYGPDGVERLLWVRDDTLTYQEGLGGTPRPVLAEASVALLNYRANIDAQENLALVWQGLSPGGADIYYSVYDAANDVFRLKEQLTRDRPLEKGMAPAFMPGGGLWLAYTKDELVEQDVVISPTLTISNVTMFSGKSDLYVLEHKLYRDLAITAEDISISAPAPQSGETAIISATVHNVGDLGVTDLEVAFYQGDPDAGRVLIGTRIVTGVLGGGMTATISHPWTVPAAAELVQIYVRVDPQNLVIELDETNNQAAVGGLVPNLAVEGVGVSYGTGQQVTVTVSLRNVGPVRAMDVPLELRLDEVTDAPVYSSTLAELGPGDETQAVVTWYVTTVPTGWHKVYAIVNPGRVVPEWQWEDNTGWAALAILPNLAIEPEDISAERVGEGMEVSVRVHNSGMRDAQGVIVRLYDRWPTIGVSPLVAEQIDLDPGQSRALVFSLPRQLWGFYAGVNVDGAVEERDLGDNVALYGALPRFIYLPLILKSSGGL
jgi:hypothetical protein